LVGDLVGVFVGFFVGAVVGARGAMVGVLVGAFVGDLVGALEGAFVGALVGAFEGGFVGALVGDFVGFFVGGAIGALVRSVTQSFTLPGVPVLPGLIVPGRGVVARHQLAPRVLSRSGRFNEMERNVPMGSGNVPSLIQLTVSNTALLLVSLTTILSPPFEESYRTHVTSL
jgi:hypothetical protein